MQGIHQRKGKTTTFSNVFKKKKKKYILFTLNQNQPFLWSTLIWERDWDVKRREHLGQCRLREKFLYSFEKQSFIRLCRLARLFSRCWMTSNNEMVISLKGKLFRVTQFSIRHSVTQPFPFLRPGSPTREKPPGRKEVACHITGPLIHNDVWISALSWIDFSLSSLV